MNISWNELYKILFYLVRPGYLFKSFQTDAYDIAIIMVCFVLLITYIILAVILFCVDR